MWHRESSQTLAITVTIPVFVSILVTVLCFPTKHSLPGSTFLLFRPMTSVHPRPLVLAECSLETCKINLYWESGDQNSTFMKEQKQSWPRSCNHLSGFCLLTYKRKLDPGQHFPQDRSRNFRFKDGHTITKPLWPEQSHALWTSMRPGMFPTQHPSHLCQYFSPVYTHWHLGGV